MTLSDLLKEHAKKNNESKDSTVDETVNNKFTI